MPAYDTLSPRHKRFVDEYLVDLDRTRAAIEAGYGKAGAKVRGTELLGRDDVKAAIAEKQAERSKEAGDRATRAATELEAIGFMDVGTAFKDAPAGILNVKRAALVDLLKLDGAFTERVEHTGAVTVNIVGDDAGLL